MKTLVLALFTLFTLSVFSQESVNVDSLQPDSEFENILVKKLDTDSNSTSFVIWVKNGVKSHKHVFHSEVLYVIEGHGLMTIGGKEFKIAPGDYFRIPKNTYHSLKVTSEVAIKVISVQAPEFYGKDRVFEEENVLNVPKIKPKKIR